MTARSSRSQYFSSHLTQHVFFFFTCVTNNIHEYIYYYGKKMLPVIYKSAYVVHCQYMFQTITIKPQSVGHVCAELFSHMIVKELSVSSCSIHFIS